MSTTLSFPHSCRETTATETASPTTACRTRCEQKTHEHPFSCPPFGTHVQRCPSPAGTLRQQSDADTSTDDTEEAEHRHRSERQALAAATAPRSKCHTPTSAMERQRRLTAAAARAASTRSLPAGGGGGGGGSAKRRPIKVVHCREAELLPAVYARLDSGDWRERVKGLEEVGVGVFLC